MTREDTDATRRIARAEGGTARAISWEGRISFTDHLPFLGPCEGLPREQGLPDITRP